MSQDLGVEFIGVPLHRPAEELLGIRFDSAITIRPEDILRALQSRLESVSAHPRRDEPAADVVRQALHGAAQTMLNRLAKRALSSAELELVRRVIAEGGGVTDSTLERLEPIASSMGVSVGDLISTALELPSRPAIQSDKLRAVRASDEVPAQTPLPESHQQTQVAGSVRLLIFIGSGLIASIAVITIVLSLVLKPSADPLIGKPKTQSTEAEAVRGPVVDDSASDEAAAGTKQETEVIRGWPDLIREVKSCESIAATDSTEAVALFISAFDRMAATWPEASKDELLAGGNAVIDFLYSIDDRQRQDEVAAAISVARYATAAGLRDARSIRATCFSAAMTVRVLREADLQPGLRTALRTACDGVFDGEFLPREQTFDSGMKAALSAMPRLLMNESQLDSKEPISIECWQSWIECLACVEGRDTTAYDRVLSFAIEAVMLEMPDADRDSQTREIIGILGSSMVWRKDSPARTSLLMWFESPGVSSADLQALTSVIATKTGAEGVDPTMVLSAGADAVARANMREKYAQSWGVTSDRGARESELNRWSISANAALVAPVQESQISGMMMAVRHARLSSLAEALREGAAVRVPDDIDQDDARIIDRINRKNDESKLIVVETGGEREWAQRYLTELKSGSVSARVSMLGSFAETSTALNADIIAQEAVRGSPEEIRKLARKIMQDRSMDPLYVNALLRMQPKLIPGADNLQLIESMTGHALPSFRSPAWKFECRRALVSKLIQLLAKDSQIGVIDSIAESLADAYLEFRQEDDPAISSESKSDFERDPLNAAMRLRKRTQSKASGLVPSGREHASLNMIETARVRRMELATGVIQRFNAEQLACIDLLAYSIVAEEPAKSAEVRAILRSFEEARRSCSHVLEAVRIGERTRLELWMLRIGGRDVDAPDSEPKP